MGNGTVMDYLDWRGDLPLTEVKFGEIDALILSILAYSDYSAIDKAKERVSQKGALLSAAAEVAAAHPAPNNSSIAARQELLKRTAQSKRFASTRIFGYEQTTDPKLEMQFAAISFLLPDGCCAIAFRGTDSALVGWQEDFNMSFLTSVPAQEKAAQYLRELTDGLPQSMPFLTCGHSKGGNLAVYAGAHLSEKMQRRLLCAYNNDGPGFKQEVLREDGYRRIVGKIRTFIPESSVVGTLLEHDEQYQIIASKNKLFLQHDPASWEVMADHFIYLEQRSAFGRHTDVIAKEWLGSLSPEQLAEFSDVFFGILSNGQAKTVNELTQPGALAIVLKVLKTYYRSDVSRRKIITDIFGRLMQEIRTEMKQNNPGKIKK